jgi:hypothetical protein
MSAKHKHSKAMPVRRLYEVKMKKVLLAAGLAVFNAQSAAKTGNDLLADARADQRMDARQATPGDYYNAGSWIGFVQGASITAQRMDLKICLPVKSNAGQWAAVVRQYLEQNPAQLHRDASLLVQEALQRAFPCR